MISVGFNKRWKFTHRRASGVLVSDIDSVLSWDCSRAENEKGAFSMTLPANYRYDFFADDIIEFRRSWDGGQTFSLVDETCWFVRDAQYSWENGHDVIELSGHDTTGLLERRIVAWFATATSVDGQNTYSRKSAPADKIVWDVFNQNFGAATAGLSSADVPPSAGGPTASGAVSMIAVNADRIMVPVTAGVETALGPVVTMEFAWKNCLSVMKDAAKAAAQNDTRLLFDIIYQPDAAAPFLFQVWLSGRGVNHATAGHPVVFSIDHENVGKITLRRVFSDEVTWVHVGGSGQGSLRITQGVTQPLPAFKRSPFYPIESFVENTKTANYNELKSTGDAELFRKRARYLFSADTRDSVSTIYGRDYKYGDLVLARHRGISGVCRVPKVHISLSAGIESLDVPLESDDDLSNAQVDN
jgi:hypothetical protein